MSSDQRAEEEHNRPDGTPCPYLAANGFCNKCGWMAGRAAYPYKRCGACGARDSLIKQPSAAWLCTACNEWDPPIVIVRKPLPKDTNA